MVVKVQYKANGSTARYSFLVRDNKLYNDTSKCPVQIASMNQDGVSLVNPFNYTDEELSLFMMLTNAVKGFSKKLLELPSELTVESGTTYEDTKLLFKYMGAKVTSDMHVNHITRI